MSQQDGAADGREPLFPEGSNAALPILSAALISAVSVFLWSDAGRSFVAMFSARSLASFDGVYLPGLVTHIFAHGDLRHLGMNMLAVVAMGAGVVRFYGRGAFLFAFLAGAVIGAGAELALSDTPVELVGASTSASALFGMAIVGMNAGRSILARIGIVLGLVALVGIVDFTINISGLLGGASVALVAHGAGFLTGATLAFLWPFRAPRDVTEH